MDASTLDAKVGKRQYLVTYSQADEQKFPSRESFAAAVEEAFNSGTSKVTVKYWACSRETHLNGGFHYHCCVNLSGSKKWIKVKEHLVNKHNIVVNFSGNHNFYLSAYRYVCKSDQNVAHSESHPQNLLSKSSPKTKKGMMAFQANCKKRKQEREHENEQLTSTSSVPPKSRKRSLSFSEAAAIIKCNTIKNYTELLAIADDRRGAGQGDLAEFVFQKSEKNLKELIQKTWAMESAKETLQKKALTRMDMIRSISEQPPCADNNCQGQWLQCAKEILDLNDINHSEFAKSLRTLLETGRGKHKNILIIGPANCGKTFILKPLQLVFKNEIFENPASDKYAWVGADKARVIFLNDFRWSKEVIQWKDLLLLLEGEPVKLPAPKNLFAEDVSISNDVPIFATSKSEIKFRGPYNATCDNEDQMMAVRWKIFKFSHPFSEQQQKNVEPCEKCFSELVFM